ncbi:hypothetical protein HMN09_00827300 [Mycena chlorophos]|uniref:Tyrosine decarboxylase n=1 Tax=Mycena chlorophos TaxID=658473 RepID=A0A8H6SSH3_MYCCL|nr:hypothetical protein HMN09_00827300 [Mycena chlorophos]
MSPLSLLDYAASVDSLVATEDHPALPSRSAIAHAESSLPNKLPDLGFGFDALKEHLQRDITPALNGGALSANYYGFVTGGGTPAALFGDWLASAADQNAQVHAPNESVASDVDDAALRLVLQLVGLDENLFTGRVFTTGATGSNIIGLALGREYAVAAAGRRQNPPANPSVAQLGLHKACKAAGVRRVQILSSMAHSSVYKAASVIGLGHGSIIALPRSAALQNHGSLIYAGEVNTGRFATSGDEMLKIRALADTYGAWLHVDAAFGLPALLLPQTPEYAELTSGVANIELADSITSDAHKNTVQVPYDCGLFFTRHLHLQQTVFQNAPFPIPDLGAIPSAHNLGVENSRRLRGLAVYASLLAYGRGWHREVIQRQVALARRIAEYIVASPHYELLPTPEINKIFMIVLFRAKDETLNKTLVERLNQSGIIYVSGTQWAGKPAARIASWNEFYYMYIENSASVSGLARPRTRLSGGGAVQEGTFVVVPIVLSNNWCALPTIVGSQ